MRHASIGAVQHEHVANFEKQVSEKLPFDDNQSLKNDSAFK